MGLLPESAPVVRGVLDACAFTAFFEADVLVHFIDSFVPASQESSVKPETRAERCPAAAARLHAPTGHCVAGEGKAIIFLIKRYLIGMC